MAYYTPPYQMGGYPMQMPSMQMQPVNPMQIPQQPQAPSSSIVWVQGEQAAKSYMVSAGNSVLLMDSDANKFYIKTADSSGMPQPLRSFEYKELQVGQIPQQQTEDYVKRSEFDQLKALVDEMKGETVNGKPVI